MKAISVMIAAFGVGLASAPLAAQAPDNDVKCMMVSNVFSQGEKDPGRRQLAAVAGIFYFGRADARLSSAQIRSQIVGLNKTVKGSELTPTMNECARQFVAKQQAFVAIAKSLAPPAGAAATPAKPATPR